MNRRMERKGVEARDQEGPRIVPMCVACSQARDEQQDMVTIYNGCHVLTINTEQEKRWAWLCLLSVCCRTGQPWLGTAVHIPHLEGSVATGKPRTLLLAPLRARLLLWSPLTRARRRKQKSTRELLEEPWMEGWGRNPRPSTSQGNCRVPAVGQKVKGPGEDGTRGTAGTRRGKRRCRRCVGDSGDTRRWDGKRAEGKRAACIPKSSGLKQGRPHNPSLAAWLQGRCPEPGHSHVQSGKV